MMVDTYAGMRTIQVGGFKLLFVVLPFENNRENFKTNYMLFKDNELSD